MPELQPTVLDKIHLQNRKIVLRSVQKLASDCLKRNLQHIVSHFHNVILLWSYYNMTVTTNRKIFCKSCPQALSPEFRLVKEISNIRQWRIKAIWWPGQTGRNEINQCVTISQYQFVLGGTAPRIKNSRILSQHFYYRATGMSLLTAISVLGLGRNGHSSNDATRLDIAWAKLLIFFFLGGGHFSRLPFCRASPLTFRYGVLALASYLPRPHQDPPLTGIFTPPWGVYPHLHVHPPNTHNLGFPTWI